MPENTTPLAFKFPLSLLQREGGLLLRASARHPEMATRLGAPFLAEARARHTRLFGVDPDTEPAPLVPLAVPAPLPGEPSSVGAPRTQASLRAGLTLAQNAALDGLEELMSLARDTARRAFKGQTVKLHDDYLVGEHESRTLADVLARAGLIADACARDADTLRAKGWTPEETRKLRDAAKAVGEPDAGQAKALADQTDATDARNREANAYFEELLTLQNAAAIQWPASGQGSVGVRGEFRFGLFPPRLPKKAAAPVPKPSAGNP